MPGPGGGTGGPFTLPEANPKSSPAFLLRAAAQEALAAGLGGEKTTGMSTLVSTG